LAFSAAGAFVSPEVLLPDEFPGPEVPLLPEVAIGITTLDAADSGLLPALFTALTVNL
jgi:hypothetical protein